MRRSITVLALLATGCTTMEPKYVRPDSSIPASWPAGDPYLVASEAGLPALTYKQVFTDPRLQTLIAEAISNNRNLRAAAANVAAAREEYRIQRANQFPTLNANAGATLSGDRSSNSSGSGSGSGSGGSSGGSSGASAYSGVRGSYNLGIAVPSFEIDLFGRLRSLSVVQLNR